MAEATAAPTLDLTTSERPKVQMDEGVFEIRHPDEFYFRDYAEIVATGERISELAEAGVGENADELDELIRDGIQRILVDAPDEVLATITPLKFRRIFSFFNRLGVEDETAPSGSALNSSPGASDSTEDSADD